MLHLCFTIFLKEDDLMLFKRIDITRWRQFEQIHITFHDRLTVLTGVNGAGKTTLLNTLNKHFGWNSPFISTPRRGRQGSLEYFSGRWSRQWSKERNEQLYEYDNFETVVGRITYGDESTGELTVPSNNMASSFQIGIKPNRSVKGMHIPSHRPIYTYKQVTSLSSKPIARR